jgi:hypothetical protein
LSGDVNTLGVCHAYITGDIYFDLALQISDADMRLNTSLLRYVHTFDLLEKSAKIEVGQEYQQGRWSYETTFSAWVYPYTISFER